jgi:hypothetical protein
MGYMGRHGRRPAEFASKSSHTHIVADAAVQLFLGRCTLPSRADEVDVTEHERLAFTPVADNPLKHIVAADGGYTEVAVKTEFPSSTICFFQFGALFFAVEDLDALEIMPFIDPDDMAKLKRIQRLKLTLPMKNMVYAGERSLTHSVRRSLYEFFMQPIDGSSLMATLRWFLYSEFLPNGGENEWVLASSPVDDQSELVLKRAELGADYTWTTPNGQIFLTDVFRLHERIDDEIGAAGIQAYVTTTIEQLILVHVIRLILQTKPDLLQRLLFIKDGPLAFFGQTSRMHEPMRALVRYLFEKHALYMAGLEKSGAFVEHAHEIKGKLRPGTVLLLDDDYIYRYIIPGVADPNSSYGRTSYYSSKLIFRASNGGVHVVTVPTPNRNSHPKETDLPNLRIILTNIEKLRCDMYDDALMPIALVNKLVSLSNHPSSRILQQFATGLVS